MRVGNLSSHDHKLRSICCPLCRPASLVLIVLYSNSTFLGEKLRGLEPGFHIKATKKRGKTDLEAVCTTDISGHCSGELCCLEYPRTFTLPSSTTQTSGRLSDSPNLISINITRSDLSLSSYTNLIDLIARWLVTPGLLYQIW